MKLAAPLLVSAFALVLVTRTVEAQQPVLTPVADAEAQDDKHWDYSQPYEYQPNPKAIIHQKAQARAHQRMARMAAMRWYGMSNERPTASPTPFTAMYSPSWQMPGGRPYAWYHGGWASSAVVIVR
jgi:hypothetical protein